MTKNPWMKWYPSDWRSDPALRMCSLAARGLWIEMLSLMHEAQPYGHLLIAKKAPTDAQLAVLAGAPPDQIPELLGELEAAGVFSRTREGAIYSRRMTRDEKRARISRKNGQNGGNPSLRNKTGNQSRVIPPDKGGDNTQKPEARSQKPEEEPDGSSPHSPPGFDEFWDAYAYKKAVGAARAAWGKAVKKASPERIINAARIYAKVRDPRYIANASTWLNQERWEDDPQTNIKPEAGHDRRPRNSRQDTIDFFRRMG